MHPNTRNHNINVMDGGLMALNILLETNERNGGYENRGIGKVKTMHVKQRSIIVVV